MLMVFYNNNLVIVKYVSTCSGFFVVIKNIPPGGGIFF